MENISNTYKCEICGNILLKSNKLLHELKCTSINNNLNFFQNNNHINNNFLNINDSFICEKCGAYLNPKDKADHILCHQLEEENKNTEKYDNENDSEISSSSNNNNINPNIVNNININIINNNNNNENVINQHYGVKKNSNYSGEEEDEDEFEKNNLVENEEIEDNEEEELFSFDDEYYGENDNGIDENVINTFPTSRIKDINKLTEEKRKCCICLENFKINDESMILPCIHIFHSNCIKKWMKRQNICPICKNKII